MDGGARQLLDARDIVTDRVHGVSLTVAAGEIVGLYGVVGAGCSELLESIFGARRCHGVVRIDRSSGQPTEPDARHDAVGIALVPPDHRTRGVVAGETIAENMVLGRGRWRSGWAYRITRATPQPNCDRTANTFRINYRHLDEQVTALSGGNQQKVVFARWLLDRPRLLLLDDPTQGIDVGAKADIYEQLRALRHDGVGIVLHTSELTELVNLVDRAVVMRDGRGRRHARRRGDRPAPCAGDGDRCLSAATSSSTSADVAARRRRAAAIPPAAMARLPVATPWRSVPHGDVEHLRADDRRDGRAQRVLRHAVALLPDRRQRA